MTERVSDATLGRRFWAVKDFSQIQAPNGPNAANVEEEEDGNSLAPNILNFVNAGGDTMAQSAINKAQLFAANHIFGVEEVQQEEARTAANRQTLVGGEQEVNNLVAEVAAVFAQRHEGVTEEDAQRVCKTALDKLMATDEFDTRAHVPLPQNNPNATRRLGVEGLNSLRNSMLGLAEMFHEGTISEKAAVVLANGKYYDASNRADLLRLVADSAAKVKEIFIGEARYNALIQQCRNRLREIQNNITPERRHELENQIAHLEELKGHSVLLRTRATVNIKTDYSIHDSSGNVKDDSKFQYKQLGKIRDSLRAFRYDIDLARRVDMGIMERMRRSYDNFRSSISDNRITRQQYQQIKTADNNFNNCLREIRTELFAPLPAIQAANNNQNVNENQAVNDNQEVHDNQVNPDNDAGHENPVPPANQAAQANPVAPARGVYDIVSAEVGLEDLIDTDASATAATALSHLTNDRIRYHKSGVEKKEATHYKAISDELGDIAERGGERSVTLRAGVYALIDLGFMAAELKGKAGGSFDVKTQINVDNADGTVSVTYSVGGRGEAGVLTQLGADPSKADSEAGFGAKVEGNAALGLTYSVTKTYANLEDFAKTISKLNMIMTPRPKEVFYAWGKATLKGLGWLVMRGLTITGFRIHKSRMDQLAYSATLRNRNIFGDMAGLFLKKRNIEILGERKSLSFNAGLNGRAQGGLYFKDGDELSSNIEGSAGLGVDYSRELSVSGKIYNSFARSLGECSAEYLKNRFDADAAEMNDAWSGSLGQIEHDGTGNARPITKALKDLSEKLTELEDSVLGNEKKDTVFWQNFAKKARLLAVLTALLMKRAQALDDVAEGAADAKAAAKAAGGYIIPRLANPIVKIPSSVYQSEFFDITNVASPRTARTVVTGSFSYDALGNMTESLMDKIGIGEKDAEESRLGALLNPVGEAAKDIFKDDVGLLGTLQFKVTRENVVSNHEDKRPWLNIGKRTIDIRLPASAPLRLAIDLIARRVIKDKAGLDQLDESMWLQEFKDSLIDSVIFNLEDIVIDDVPTLLDMSLGDLAEKYPALGKFLGGVNFLKEKYKMDYGFADATFKTLSFEFDENWRFTSFKVAEEYDAEGKLELNPATGIGIELSLSSKESYDNWKVFTKPNPVMLMKRASDYMLTGNPQGFVNFLMRSKKGVLRLMDAGVNNAQDRPNDKYWEQDAAAMDQTIAECRIHINNLVNGNSVVAEQAKSLRQTFADLAASVKNPPAGIEPNERIKLAADFFTVASQIYFLAEMARPHA